MRLITAVRKVVMSQTRYTFFSGSCTQRSLSSGESEIGSNRQLKVPQEPTWLPVDESALPPVTTVSIELINHLERLSLVEFGNKQGIERLAAAIRFADTLLSVDTTDVEPMTSVLEDRALYLRHDEVTDGKCRDQLLSLAKKTIEEYYVAPPGNIPLSRDRQYNDQDSDNQPAT